MSELKCTNNNVPSNINELVRSMDRSQGQIEVILEEVKKKLQKLEGGLQVLTMAQATMHDRIRDQDASMISFEDNLKYSKEKILDSLSDIKESFDRTNDVVDKISRKVSSLEESSRFRKWIYYGISKNYKLAMFGFSCIGGGAYATHTIEAIFK
jgi:uncharacterized protein YukE